MPETKVSIKRMLNIPILNYEMNTAE
jgi:hypothetical protein